MHRCVQVPTGAPEAGATGGCEPPVHLGARTALGSLVQEQLVLSITQPPLHLPLLPSHYWTQSTH